MEEEIVNKFKQIKKYKTNRFWMILFAVCDLVVNVWYHLLFNFHILVYNYFGGITVIIIQAIGFYYTN